nr:MAG TPA: hypothetical protein [Caudoviricetes sp.]
MPALHLGRGNAGQVPENCSRNLKFRWRERAARHHYT